MTGYLLVSARGLVAAVLLVSAGSKLRGRAAFAGFGAWLGQLTVVPANRVTPVAALVAAAEAVAVPLLAIPATAIPGLALAAGLMAAFAAAIGVVTRRGVSVPCRCFGVSARPLGAAHVTRNILLAAVALAAAAVAALRPGPAPGPADTALALLTGVAAAAVIVRLDDILPN
jgi:methylamine utilization protein MauE